LRCVIAASTALLSLPPVRFLSNIQHKLCGLASDAVTLVRPRFFFPVIPLFSILVSHSSLRLPLRSSQIPLMGFLSFSRFNKALRFLIPCRRLRRFFRFLFQILFLSLVAFIFLQIPSRRSPAFEGNYSRGRELSFLLWRALACFFAWHRFNLSSRVITLKDFCLSSLRSIACLPL